jgi:hypothetical protein
MRKFADRRFCRRRRRSDGSCQPPGALVEVAQARAQRSAAVITIEDSQLGLGGSMGQVRSRSNDTC